MKSAHKLSVASLAALGLPIVGLAGAAAQELTASDDAASTATAQAPQVKELELRSNGTITQVVSAEVSNDGSIDPFRGWSEDDFDAYGAYWAAGFNYQQLLVLAEEWNMSEIEAKARAGSAILAGDTSSFDDIVAGIAPGPGELTVGESEALEAEWQDPTDAFWEAGFTYDDAVELAGDWNVDSWEAKVLAAELIEAGNQDEVEALLAV